ncbi:hypothetical protein CFY91_03400 [Pseudomonas fluvialis]|nr:hypothetical protein CFY91_03400 [Pseudomonas fluvialis]
MILKRLFATGASVELIIVLCSRVLKSKGPSTGYLTVQDAQRDISHYLIHRYNWVRLYQFNDGPMHAVADEKLNPQTKMG